MDSPGPDVHSFLVKIWIEPAGAPGRRRDWHGWISHVPEGEPRAFRDLTCLALYVDKYLRAAGLSAAPWWVMLRRIWHRRRKHHVNASIATETDARTDGPETR